MSDEKAAGAQKAPETQDAPETEETAEPEKTTLLGGFKAFLMQGNVVELAVAVVIGTAFSKIVSAVVEGLINPLVGAIGTKDLAEYETCIKAPCGVDDKTGEAYGVLLKWGPVVGAALTFLITAAVVYFLMILPMARYKERRARKLGLDMGPELTDIDLLTEIRDLMIAQQNPPAQDGSSAGGGSGPGDGTGGEDGGGATLSTSFTKE